MKALLALLSLFLLSFLPAAAQLAPASAQYQLDGAAPLVRTEGAGTQRVVDGVTVITLWNGQQLIDPKPIAINAASVTFKHRGGIAQVERRHLPPELRASLASAAAGDVSREAYRAEAEKRIAAERRATYEQSARLAQQEALRQERERSLPVVYEVTSSNAMIDATYVSAPGKTKQETINSTKWRHEFTAKRGDHVYISIQLPALRDVATVRLLVDGIEVLSESVRDAHKIATLSYSLPEIP